MVEKEKDKNKVSINLSAGFVELESTTESVDSLIKKASGIAERIGTLNGCYVLMKDVKE